MINDAVVRWQRGYAMLIVTAYAYVDPAYASPVKHYVGLPPIGPDGSASRIELPRARVIFIAEELPYAYLFRYSARGAFCGDTWHESPAEAIRQAEFEFGAPLVWHDAELGICDSQAASYAAELLGAFEG